jgi:hypothetical protein
LALYWDEMLDASIENPRLICNNRTIQIFVIFVWNHVETRFTWRVYNKIRIMLSQGHLIRIWNDVVIHIHETHYVNYRIVSDDVFKIPPWSRIMIEMSDLESWFETWLWIVINSNDMIGIGIELDPPFLYRIHSM